MVRKNETGKKNGTCNHRGKFIGRCRTKLEIGQTNLTGKGNMKAKISIIMGSKSDLPVMESACDILKKLDIPFELKVVSAHRTPELMIQYAKEAHERGIKVIIAGAGGAAHLPGMIASCCTLPIIGVPIKSRNSIDGWDSVLSILQMPKGVPVATVALNNAFNAGILAAQILGISDQKISQRLDGYKEELRQLVSKQNQEL